MKDKEKTKQIMVNVSEEAKAQINELKETLELTDKELVAVMLEIFNAASDEDIKTAAEKITIEKQKAKIEARLAKLIAQQEKLQKELDEPTEDPNEDCEVVYSAAEEEQEVEA